MNVRQIFNSFLCKMSTFPSVLVPVGVRGMKKLDRVKFTRNITVPVLTVPDEKVSKVVKICKPYFLKIDNFKPVRSLQDDDEKSSHKRIYLNPEKIAKWDDISTDDCASLRDCNIDDKNFSNTEIQLHYDNFKSDAIFKAVLPEDEDIISGFSQIGHIIHLNLRDHLLEYRFLIGEVLIDKIKTCRTVVNKSNIIDNTYRNFSMEVLAGEEDYLVTVKENQCKFQFDFSKVYWNPRLCKEHERIISMLKPHDILFDVFCGVGPFAIPAAKQKCKVFANDLNPESFKWLNENARHNKISTSNFKSYNLDGKDFICDIFKDFLINYLKGNEHLENGVKIYITMNLPAMAVEFLGHFRGLIKDETLLSNLSHQIIVHVYCFATGDDPSKVAKQMVIDNIGTDISGNILEIFDVRNVSPKKEMVRVSFSLTKEILKDNDTENDFEPPIKKICTKQE